MRMITKTILWLYVILLTACSGNETSKEEIIRKVKLEEVRKASEIVREEYSGIIKENRSVNLAFRVAGPILNLNIKEGDYVKKGDLIAQIDPRDYQIQMDVAQAQYNQVKAETERVVELYNRKSVPAKDYEKAVEGEKMVSTQLKHAQDQLNDTRLYAPFSGYIQKVNFESGEMINAGMPLASIIDMSKYRIDVDVPVTIYDQKDRFVQFSCRSAKINSGELPIKLAAYDVKANSNQLYRLQFLLDPSLDKKLKPGMSVKVYIDFKSQVDDGFYVPVKAIVEEDGKSFLWVYNQSDSTVSRTFIETGAFAGDGNILVNSGLTGDELIVVAGVHVLKDQQKVRPMKPVSETNVGGLL